MEQSKDELWPYFTDTDILTECAPGCKEMTLISPRDRGGHGRRRRERQARIRRRCRRHSRRSSGRPRDESGRPRAAKRVRDGRGDGTQGERQRAARPSSGRRPPTSPNDREPRRPRAQERHTKRLVKKFFSKMQAKADEGVEAESELEAAPEQDATLETDGWSRSFRPTAAPVRFGPFDGFRSVRCVLARVSSADCRSTSVFSGRPFAGLWRKRPLATWGSTVAARGSTAVPCGECESDPCGEFEPNSERTGAETPSRLLLGLAELLPEVVRGDRDLTRGFLDRESGSRAALIEVAMLAGASIIPPSPTPFAPVSVNGDGVSVCSIWISGTFSIDGSR